MKCITLWQPWATWIALGWKTIETRTHNRFASLVGERIAIHAGKKWDPDAVELASPWMEDWQIEKTHEFSTTDIPYGVVVCTAGVHNHFQLAPAHSRYALIDCRYTRRYGLLLTNILKLSKPVPAKGKQGIWNIELTVRR